MTEYVKIENAGFTYQEEVEEYLEAGNIAYTPNGSKLYYDDNCEGIEQYRVEIDGFDLPITLLWAYLQRFKKHIPWYDCIPEEGLQCIIQLHSEDPTICVLRVFSYDVSAHSVSLLSGMDPNTPVQNIKPLTSVNLSEITTEVFIEV